jgi:hypothetical protein
MVPRSRSQVLLTSAPDQFSNLRPGLDMESRPNPHILPLHLAIIDRLEVVQGLYWYSEIISSQWSVVNGNELVRD